MKKKCQLTDRDSLTPTFAHVDDEDTAWYLVEDLLEEIYSQEAWTGSVHTAAEKTMKFSYIKFGKIKRSKKILKFFLHIGSSCSLVCMEFDPCSQHGPYLLVPGLPYPGKKKKVLKLIQCFENQKNCQKRWLGNDCIFFEYSSIIFILVTSR